MKIKRKKNGGFTLMEMLIVVAIIAVLVAIAIPTFSGSLHKAQVAADEANIRAYFAQLQGDYMLTGEYDTTIPLQIHSYDRDARTSITFSDGSTVQLQAGFYYILRADEYPTDGSRPASWTGYNIFYTCRKGDCSITLGGGRN